MLLFTAYLKIKMGNVIIGPKRNKNMTTNNVMVVQDMRFANILP